jgi:hypothetical protein
MRLIEAKNGKEKEAGEEKGKGEKWRETVRAKTYNENKGRKNRSEKVERSSF